MAQWQQWCVRKSDSHANILRSTRTAKRMNDSSNLRCVTLAMVVGWKFTECTCLFAPSARPEDYASYKYVSVNLLLEGLSEIYQCNVYVKSFRRKKCPKIFDTLWFWSTTQEYDGGKTSRVVGGHMKPRASSSSKISPGDSQIGISLIKQHLR